MKSKTPSVLFLITGLAKGGAETQLVRLASELRRRDWSVHIASMDGTCAFQEKLDNEGIEFHPLTFMKSESVGSIVSGIRRVRRLILAERPDVLVTFMYHANLLGSVVSLLTGIPTISSIRNENFGSSFRELLAHIGGRFNKRLTINSSNAANSLIQRGVLIKDKTVVIPNSISVGPPRTLNQHTKNGPMKWLAVGRLYPQKDYPNLLQAFRRVVRTQPNCRLSIAGEGPLRDSIKRLAGELNLLQHLELLGQRNDIEHLLRSSDALVLSSAWEGMPNVIMEAMAQGTPVVATNVGGVSELVRNGVTGYLCEPRNPAELSKAMLRLAEHPAPVRHTMGEAGRQIVRSDFSIESITSTWENLLLAQMDRKR